MYYHINRNSHTHHLRMSDVATSAQNSRIFYLQRSTVGEPGHQFFGAKIGFLQNKKKNTSYRALRGNNSSLLQTDGGQSSEPISVVKSARRSSLISVPRAQMRQKTSSSVAAIVVLGLGSIRFGKIRPASIAHLLCLQQQ